MNWLTDKKIDFEFHDFKTKGITDAKLKEWCAQAGWQNLINKAGTTWRQLEPSVQEKVMNQSAAIALMKEKTSLIKRPIIESKDKIVVFGFDPEKYAKVKW